MDKGDLASFNPRTKAHASLILPTCASVPDNHPLPEGGGETAHYIRFADLGSVAAAEAGLLATVDSWCTSRD